MSKYYGIIGFALTEKTAPGVYSSSITEREYAGDITNVKHGYKDTSNIVDDISLNMVLSIIADPFACSNIGCIKYIQYLGSKWKVTSIEFNYPRLSLTIGGLYNE